MNWIRRLTHQCQWPDKAIAKHPDTRKSWFCYTRKCPVCGRIQYESLNVVGAGVWHNIDDPSGAREWEWPDVKAALNHFYT